MTKNEFKMISIFKIIIWICTKMFELCGKISTFLPERCLFILCIFDLNKEGLIQQVCLKKYIKNKICNSTLYKTKKQKKKNKKIIQFHNYHF